MTYYSAKSETGWRRDRGKEGTLTKSEAEAQGFLPCLHRGGKEGWKYVPVRTSYSPGFVGRYARVYVSLWGKKC